VTLRLEKLNDYSNRKFIVLYDSLFNLSGFELQNIRLYDNSSSNCLIYLYQSMATVGNLIISNCNFDNFDFINFDVSQISISNSFFSNITGTSVFQTNSFLKFSGIVNIFSLTFLQNSLTDYNLLYSSADLSGNLWNSTFTNNTLLGSSMMIILQESENFNFQLFNSFFIFNTFPSSLISFAPSNTSSSLCGIDGLTFYYNQGNIILDLLEIDVIEVSNCQFLNNTGTAIQLVDSNFENFSNIYFFGNQGNSSLPGISIDGSFLLDTVLFDSLQFISNSFFTTDDKYSIGVSLLIQNVNNSNITNCTFMKNTACFNISASGDSGIVFIGTSLNVIMCSFVQNLALSSTMALNFQGNSLWVHECVFKQNSQIDGSFSTLTMAISAIYDFFNFSCNICQENLFSQGMITLSSYSSYSFFHSYKSVYQGNVFNSNGQFYLDESPNRTIYVENCTINDNFGYGYSTILYVYIYSKIILENITFYNTIAINNTCVSSPLLVVWIYSSNVFVTIIQTTYLDMMTYDFGGPLFNIFGLESGFNMTMDSCVVMRSNTDQAGIFWVFQLNLNVSNCIFKDLYAETTAAVFYLLNSVTVYFTNSTIINASTANNAAAIYANDNSILVMQNITISDCYSIKDIILVQTFSQIIIRNVSIVNFTNNSVENIFTISNTGNLIHEAHQLIMKNITNQLFYIQKAGFLFENVEFSGISDILFYVKFAIYVEIINSSFHDNYCNNIDQYCFLYGSSSIPISVNSCIIFNTNNLNSQTLFLIETNSVLTINNLTVQLPDNTINSGFLQSSSSDISIEKLFINQSNFFLVSSASCFSLNLSEIYSEFSSYEIQFMQSYISASETLYFSMNNSVFKNFNFSGCFLISISNTPFLLMENNSFSTIISVSKGSVIMIESSFGIVSNSYFFNNSAERASCIYYSTPLPFTFSNATNLIISNNVFEGNNAIFNGAGVYFEFYPLYLINNIFKDNIGAYAMDYSSFPLRIDFTNLKPNLTVSPLVFLSEEHSGQDILEDIGIIIYDAYNQQIKENLNTQMNIEINPSLIETLNLQSEDSFKFVKKLLNPNITDFSDYGGSFSVSNIEGKTSLFQETDYTYLFTELLLTSTPTQMNFLFFDSTLFQTLDKSTFLNITQITQNQSYFNPNEFINDQTGLYNLFLPINVSACLLGEIYDSLKNTCDECSAGTYSLNLNDISCQPCPDEATCSGGNDFSLKFGYWRSGVQNNIYLCEHMLESCLGGFDSNCSEGYEGPLCDRCSKSSDGVKRQKIYSGTCTDCYSIGVNVLILLAFFVLIMIISFFLAHSFMGNNLKSYQKASLRIFINFFHLVTILETYNIALPQYIPITIYIFSNLVKIGDFWFSLACLLENPGDYVEGIILMLFIVFFSLMIVVYSHYYRKEKRENTIQRIELFIYLILPSFVDYLYSQIICIEIDGVYVRVSQKISVCWDMEYTLWFGLFYFPLIVIFGLILPFIVLDYNNQKISKLFRIGVGFLIKYGQNLRSDSKIKSISENKREPSLNNNVFGVQENYLQPFQNYSNPIVCEKSSKVVKTENKENNSTYHFLFIGYRTKSLFWESVNHFIKIGLILLNRSPFQNDVKLVTILFLFIFILAFDMSIHSLVLPLLNFISFFSKFIIVGMLYGLLWFLSDSDDNEQEEWKRLFLILIVLVYAFYMICMLWIIFIKDQMKIKLKRCLHIYNLLYFKKH